MAYVPGFLHDVFISYASIDDKAKGLITYFREQLVIALGTEGIKAVDGDSASLDVFLDLSRIKAGSDLTEQVLTGARSCAVFISFYSPAYLDSNWCVREATEFSANFDQDRPKLEGRLFVVSLGKRELPEKSSVLAFRTRRYRRFFYVHT